MNGRIEDYELDDLLWRELQLDYRAPDTAFTARVERALVEEQRFARARATISRDLLHDMIGLAAVAAALLVLSFAPGVGATLAAMDPYAWAGVAGMLMLWLATRRPSRTLG